MIYRHSDGRLRYGCVLEFPDGSRKAYDAVAPVRKVSIPVAVKGYHAVIGGPCMNLGIEFASRDLVCTREWDAEGRRVYRQANP